MEEEIGHKQTKKNQMKRMEKSQERQNYKNGSFHFSFSKDIGKIK